MRFADGIAAQVESLRTSVSAVSKAVADLDVPRSESTSVAFVGIGASYYAAWVGAAHLRADGGRAFAASPGELLSGSAGQADVYVAVSASGRSRETVEVMRGRGAAVQIGIAKTAESPLNEVVDTVISTESGEDTSPCTTSYSASALAAGMLADRISGGSMTGWERVPELVERTIEESAEPVSQAGEMIRHVSSVDLVGSGASFGSAGEGALLLREFPRVAATAWETYNYLHGPMESNDGSKAVVVLGDGRELDLARSLAGFGIPTVLLTQQDMGEAENLVVCRFSADGGPAVRALAEIVPLQILTSGWAAERGIEECNFRYRQTDTKVKPAA